MAQEIKKSSSAPQTPAPRYRDPFERMRSEIDQVFNSFLGRAPSLFGDAPAERLVPSIDVRETPAGYLVEAELPGIDEKDVSLTLQDGVLTIKGEKKSERKEEKDEYHLMERSYGSFQRSFQLDSNIDDGKIAATFEKGVLKINLPKRPDAVKTEKRIEIGKASS